MAKPRLLLADDHSLVLEGYRRILDGNVSSLAWSKMGERFLRRHSIRNPTSPILDVSRCLTQRDRCRDLTQKVAAVN